MPTAIRGRDGRSLASPASRTAGEGGDVRDPHRAPSRRSCSTSRISACSLTWPRIAWSISTTGASAHCPKQATVRIVNRRSGVVRRQLVGAAGGLVEPELELHALQQRPRAPRVAGGPAADGHGVGALRLEVEEGEERRDADRPATGGCPCGPPRTRASPSAGTCGGCASCSRSRMPSRAPGRPSCSPITRSIRSWSSGWGSAVARPLVIGPSKRRPCSAGSVQRRDPHDTRQRPHHRFAPEGYESAMWGPLDMRFARQHGPVAIDSARTGPSGGPGAAMGPPSRGVGDPSGAGGHRRTEVQGRMGRHRCRAAASGISITSRRSCSMSRRREATAWADGSADRKRRTGAGRPVADDDGEVLAAGAEGGESEGSVDRDKDGNRHACQAPRPPTRTAGWCAGARPVVDPQGARTAVAQRLRVRPGAQDPRPGRLPPLGGRSRPVIRSSHGTAPGSAPGRVPVRLLLGGSTSPSGGRPGSRARGAVSLGRPRRGAWTSTAVPSGARRARRSDRTPHPTADHTWSRVAS